MIRIIKGIYGYKNTNGAIEPKTCKDEPFCLTDEQEERLVSKGVAEYVEVAPVQPQKEMLKGHLDREQITKCGYNDIKKLAKEMGIPAKGSKDELVEKILAEGVDYPEEEPPILNPEEPQ